LCSVHGSCFNQKLTTQRVADKLSFAKPGDRETNRFVQRLGIDLNCVRNALVIDK
jgi:hypothetical protein